MIKAIILAICIAVAAASIEQHIEIVNNLHAQGKTTWRAEKNKFTSWTYEELQTLMGTQVKPESNTRVLTELGNMNALPLNFDSREQWGSCVHPIRNQGHCGSCWAFSASEALSDRFCIKSGGSIDVVLSPQDMVSCDHLNMGCSGGIPYLAWTYLKDTGIVAESCFPYADMDGDKVSCASSCANGDQFHKYRVSDFAHVGTTLFFWHNATAIAEDIMNNGPVQGAFTVYEDFMSYKDGVYQHTSGKELGGHAIKIIGFGVDSTSGKDVPYWIVANSWGTDWGLNGFFHIARGSNECGIEATVYSGTPRLA